MSTRRDTWWIWLAVGVWAIVGSTLYAHFFTSAGHSFHQTLERADTSFYLVISGFISLTIWTVIILIRFRRMTKLRAKKEEYMDHLEHTFSTPISIIQRASASQMKALADENFDEARKLGSYVHAQAARLKQISDHLKDKGIEDIRDHLNLRQVSLSRLFEHCIEDMKIKYSLKKVDITTVLYPPNIEMTADPYYLRIAILNVLDNALLYNEMKDDLHIELEAHKDYDKVHIHISDNGIGIDHRELSHLGKKYYRPGQHRHIKGLGLGLYQVRQIAKAHGGRVHLEGDTTAGLSVKIVLPLVEESE